VRSSPGQQKTDIDRAKVLKKALKQGTPSLSDTREPTISATPSYWVADQAGLQEAYINQLVDCAPEAICIVDLQFNVLRLNAEFTRIFGYSQEDIVGQPIESFFFPVDRNSEFQWGKSVLARGQRATLETKRLRKDGTLVEVYASVAPVMVAGKQIATYALYRDITAQKRAEAVSSALYRISEKAGSTQDLQEFYAALHAIVGGLMPANNFYIALYDARTQLLNFPYYVDEIHPTPAPRKLSLGRTEYVLRTGESLLCSSELFAEMVAHGELEASERDPLDWLGAPLKVEDSVLGVVAVQSYSPQARLTEADQQVLAFVSNQLAIAIERKQNQEALRRSESRHRLLVESAVYGIYRCSLDGQFLDVNPALVAMMGYDSAQEVLALDPRRDVFLDQNEHSRIMRDLKRGVRLTHVEVRWKHRDGHTITLQLSGSLVNNPDDGAGKVVEIIAEDITARRVLEDQFRQSQKMEAVGRLAAGVAHDFNNLLTVIRGYAEVLLGSSLPNDSLKSKVESIYDAANRAASLTRQLLAFSRKQLLELKPVDLNAVVTDLERLLRPLIGENIQWSILLATSLYRTRADCGQIEQVLMNLVVNAKDAMPSGGKITIETANVALDEEFRKKHRYVQPGDYVMLSVSDTGQGMDQQTQDNVFEPFFTTKEEGKGTGLGLSTVYGIIKQSKGYIFVDSQLGQGSTFRIYLPQIEETVDSAPPSLAPSSIPSEGSETILLVEDEECVRQLIRETLEMKGYKVLEADSGDAALRIAASQTGRIDLMITDMILPGMSGQELAKRLTERYPTARILFVSGYTEEAIIHQGMLDEGTSFLQKPFRLRELAQKVRQVLNSAAPR
jgi:two-component system cell cycle sensor histidine kinase/response regulator CckA